MWSSQSRITRALESACNARHLPEISLLPKLDHANSFLHLLFRSNSYHLLRMWKIATYPAFCVLSVALSHHNSKAHPSRNILISSPQNQILNCSSCTNTFLFGLLLTFPISHQAIVMWSTRSAFKHHSPDVSRPSVFSMNS